MARIPLTGQALRELREQRNLTLREAARLGGGISWQGLAKLETGGRQPQLATLQGLAIAYQVAFLIDQAGIWIISLPG